MLSKLKLRKPCAKPSGINIDLAFFADKTILKCLPKVLEFFLKSIAISRIFPFNTETYLPCGNLV